VRLGPIEQDGGVAGESSYVERVPAPALTEFVSSVWIQQVGDRQIAQRHVPHGGAELRCVLGEAPRLLGPLTAASHQYLPAGSTVVGVRVRPGVVGGLAGMPADELLDEDVLGSDLWPDTNRLTDLLAAAATPQTALDRLQSFVARRVTAPDPLVVAAVARLMPWQRGGTAALPGLLSISERQLRRRCRAAVGVGPKELQRVLHFQWFLARIQASVSERGGADVDLARWAVESGYYDQAHLTRECHRIVGMTPGAFLAHVGAACTCGHDHAASYRPMLRPGNGRSVQERLPARV
jgi:AraC-like DNA-binding protein